MESHQNEHNQEFHLQGEVKVIEERCAMTKKNASSESGFDKDFFIDETVLLIPDTFPTEWTKFVMVYAEEFYSEGIRLAKVPEFVCLVGHPVHRPCRIVMQYPDKHSEGIYFRVMTKDVQDLLLQVRKSVGEKMIPFTILPQNKENDYHV